MTNSAKLASMGGSGSKLSEHTLKLSDGTEMFYRAWLPDTPFDKVLVIFHRGHEHSGRVQDIVESLDLPNVAVFAWDARGHGQTTGERGYAPDLATMVGDVDCFIRHISETYHKRIEDMVILAQSVGAVTISAWVHDYAPPIRALVLAAPAFVIKLYVPLAIPGLRLMLKLRKGRKMFVNSYVKAQMLTHDFKQVQSYNDDGLIARSIAANILLDVHDTSARLIDDAGAIRTPTLLLAAGADWVVKLGPQRRFFERLGSPIKRMKVFPGMYHDLLHEKDRHLVIDEARQFIVEAFQRESASPPLIQRRPPRLHLQRIRSPGGTSALALDPGFLLSFAKIGHEDHRPIESRCAARFEHRFRFWQNARLRL